MSLKKKVTYQEIREGALNPSTYGLSLTEITELVMCKTEKHFMKKLKKFILKKMKNG